MRLSDPNVTRVVVQAHNELLRGAHTPRAERAHASEFLRRLVLLLSPSGAKDPEAKHRTQPATPARGSDRAAA